MTDDDTTVMDRLLAAGISLERAEEHLRAGRVEVDGQLVAAGDAPAAKPARVVLVAP